MKRDDVYLSQIEDRIKLIKRHLKRLTREKFVKSELHRSAVVRELEVIGEAARLVSEKTRNKLSNIPWKQLVGMRNRLIHEYFDVDHSIVWDVATVELSKIEPIITDAILELAPPIHPWRQCPLGYYWVKTHSRTKNSGTTTSVRSHCRKNPTGKDQLYPDEILADIRNYPFTSRR